jgi:hypothetical protein
VAKQASVRLAVLLVRAKVPGFTRDSRTESSMDNTQVLTQDIHLRAVLVDNARARSAPPRKGCSAAIHNVLELQKDLLLLAQGLCLPRWREIMSEIRAPGGGGGRGSGGSTAVFLFASSSSSSSSSSSAAAAVSVSFQVFLFLLFLLLLRRMCGTPYTRVIKRKHCTHAQGS